MYCNCGNVVENRDTGLCASCAHADRRAAKIKPKVIQPIKKVTQKRANELKEYPKLKKEYISHHPECEVKIIGCLRKANEIHHCSLSAKNFLNTDTWLAICPNCHRDLEDMPAEQRRERGWLTD